MPQQKATIEVLKIIEGVGRHERQRVKPKKCMIIVMADVICASDDFDGKRLNDPQVWQRFMKAVLDRMQEHPDEEICNTLDTIDLEQFQQWIDDPQFWEALNMEIDRRTQVLMTLLPSDHQGHC